MGTDEAYPVPHDLVAHTTAPRQIRWRKLFNTSRGSSEEERSDRTICRPLREVLR
jgi:hypothetical protein